MTPAAPAAATVSLRFRDEAGAAALRQRAGTPPAAAAGAGGAAAAAAAAALEEEQWHAHALARVLRAPAAPLAASATGRGAATAFLSSGGSGRPASADPLSLLVTVAGHTLRVTGTAVPIDEEVAERSTIAAFRAATRGRRVPGVSAVDVRAVVEAVEAPAAGAKGASPGGGGAATMRATVVTAEDGSGGCEVHVFPSSSSGGLAGAHHSYMLSLPAPKFGQAGGGAGGGKASVTTPMPGKVVKVRAPSMMGVGVGGRARHGQSGRRCVRSPIEGVPTVTPAPPSAPPAGARAGGPGRGGGRAAPHPRGHEGACGAPESAPHTLSHSVSPPHPQMEHVIKAPAAGTVAAVHFAVGEFVEDGRVLVAFKA